MEIARQTFILPQPKSGGIGWKLHIASGREHAEVSTNAQGEIVGTDLSGTQWAKSLNLLTEPALIAEAAAVFRATFGTEPVLTAVSIKVIVPQGRDAYRHGKIISRARGAGSRLDDRGYRANR